MIVYRVIEMKTKLVYVLTCALDATYIEQALISIWSARYHNPDAQILLLIDDKTDELLIGTRGELLDYISKKIVVPFEDTTLTPMYRSRYIKTRVRSWVEGDFLFIDSDTIINGSLAEIDDYPYDEAAVMESNLPISQFHPSLYAYMAENACKIGWNPEEEQYYFSSGVIYAKDTPIAHALFEKWHSNWLQGLSFGVRIDQPSLAKANIECGRVIRPIDNKWNCIMFTNPRLAKEALIMHFAAYRNMSFLFSKRVLGYIKENGLTDYIKYYILHPTQSYIPFDSEFYHYQLMDYIKCFRILTQGVREYAKFIDTTFADYTTKNIVYKLLQKRLYTFAVVILVLLKWKKTRLNKKYKYTENICAR